MLSIMESSSTPGQQAAEALQAVDAARAGLVDDIRLPPGYHAVIAVAIALQVGAVAWWTVTQTGIGTVVVLAASLLLAAVLGWQVHRFRALNGVWVDGFASRAAFGSTVLASVSYAGGLAAATWAGFEGVWWLVPLAAALAGVGYVAAGERWMRRYRADPAAEAVGLPLQVTLLLGAAAVAGLLLLLLNR